MPASKRKSIYGILGKPVASSTPIKGPFDTNIENYSDVEKTRNHALLSGVNKLPNADECRLAKIREHQAIQYHLEIVSSGSDSDSEVMPYKKTKPISPKANRCTTTGIDNARRNKTFGKGKMPKAVADRKKIQNTEGSSLSASDNAVISPSHSNAIRSRKPQPHESSLENSDINVDVVNHKDGDGLRRNTLSKRPGLRLNHSPIIKIADKKQPDDLHLISGKKDKESSSDNSDHEEYYCGKSRKPQNNDSDKNFKKITTPVTGMPPALARQSLSRTLSRISAPTSDKFMVDIPKNFANSFSASLQLIKRRIDFEKVDKPKMQRLDNKESGFSKNKRTDFEGVDESKKQKESDGKRDEHKNLRLNDGVTDGSKRTDFKEIDESKKPKHRKTKGDESKRDKKQKELWKSPEEADNATIPRKLTALKPVYSSEKETQETSLEGVRKSSRTRIPPIAFWMGKDSKEGNQLFAPNQIKTKSNSHASLTVPHQEKKNHLKNHSSLLVGQIKDITKKKEKNKFRKSVQWEEDRRQESRNADSTQQMKVCFTKFNESVFVGTDNEDDEDEIGVQFATSLQTHDMQSEFIRLLPGAQTTDLISCSFNQLYTVLENTVLLYVEGAPKQFDLHSQFYVNKGVSHKLRNNSGNSSLLLQVIIQK